MKIKSLLFCFVFTLFSELCLQAQTKGNFVHFGFGFNSYIGDLAPRSGSIWNPSDQPAKSSFLLGMNRYLDETVYFDISVCVGSIEGNYSFNSDISPEILSKYSSINRYFLTDFISAETSLNAELIKWSFTDIYIGVGIGLITYQIRDENKRNLRLVPESRLPGENYGQYAFYMPIKTGFILFQESQINLIWELSWNILRSDYIDNIGELGNEENDMIFRNLAKVRYRF